MKMKKWTIIFAALCIGSSSMQAGLPQLNERPVFTKGDVIANVGLGIGSIAGSTTFGQQIGMEWCIVDGWINNRASLGIGFSVANSAFGKYTNFKYGTYNYRYPIYGPSISSNREVWEIKNYGNRSGIGSTWCDVTQDNLAFLAIGSCHFQFIDRLDTYGSVGLGFGLNFRSFRYYGAKGFESDNNMTSNIRRWSYNDLDHVVWSDGSQDKKTGACFAMSFLIGARYYFTEHFAANVELGMIGGCFPSQGAGCSILGFGVSYKF